MKKIFLFLVATAIYLLVFGEKYTAQKCVLLQDKGYKQSCNCVTLSGDTITLGSTTHQKGLKGDTVLVSLPIIN